MFNILGLLTALSFIFIFIQGISKLFDVDLEKYTNIKFKTANIYAISIIFISFIFNLLFPEVSDNISQIDNLSTETTIINEQNTNTTIVEKTEPFDETTLTTNFPDNSETYYEVFNYDLPELLENINNLVIDNSSSFVTGYDRDEFGGWVDEDNDCQNTRAEILIDTSEESVAFRNLDNCVVGYGYWYDPYTDEIYTDASNLDIDHFVPLKNAYISGAYLWDDSRKKEYSNYRGYQYHLIPVFKSANREKSAYGPEVWLPENEDFHCGYINIWVEIKTYWGLTVNEKEYEKILEIISSC